MSNHQSLFSEFGAESIQAESNEFLQNLEHEGAKIAQFVNNQQAFMADNFFYGNTAAPNVSFSDQTADNVHQNKVGDKPSGELTANQTHLPDDQSRDEQTASAPQMSQESLGIKFQDIEYRDNDLIPSIRPKFIKQYYARFINNVCINLASNPTVQAVKSAQMRLFYRDALTPAINLQSNVNDNLTSKLAQSVVNTVTRYKNEKESRIVYWHPQASVSYLKINNRTFSPVTNQDVIIPVFDDIFSRCNQQKVSNIILKNYESLYIKLPVANDEYSDDSDMHHNPQYVSKLTSLQQSIDFLKTSSWYIFGYELNGLFTNKRQKTLSYARGYLAALCEHYNNDKIRLTPVKVKSLGNQVKALKYWVEGANHSFLNISSVKPHLSQKYAHHSIPHHQLAHEVLAMLSKPIIKNEPLNNLNYDISNGRLYLAGMEETTNFWLTQLSMINKSGATKENNVRSSILKTAAKKSRTFYPPSALYGAMGVDEPNDSNIPI